MGIGLGPNNPRALHRAQWRGANLLGEILTEVRETLMKSSPIVKGDERDTNVVRDKQKPRVYMTLVLIYYTC